MSSRPRHTRIHVLVSFLLLVKLNQATAQQPAPDSTAQDSAFRKPPVVLAPLRVVGEPAGYRAARSVTVTKTDTPLLDVPQSVSVITRSVIGDQRMVSLADLVRYVPGATMAQGEGNRDQPTIRGNNSNSDLFVDGVRDDVEYFRDLYNVERVEVPKGSNALIFGRGAGGGLINRVTKAAQWAPTAELSLQGGVHNGKRGTVDLGRGLAGLVAARLNGVYENSDSYRDGFNLRRYGLAPTVTMAAGGRGSIRAGYEHFNDHRTADRGIPSFAGQPVNTAPSTFFGDPSLSYARATVDAVTGVLELRPVDGFTVRNHTRYADYRKFYQNVFPGAVNAAGDQVSLTAYNNRVNRRNLFNQTDLTYRFRTWGASHLLLGGGELGRQVSDAFRNTGFFNNTATSISAPVAAPMVESPPVTFRQGAIDADASTTALTAGAYVQDQVQLAPALLAVAGVRFDRFDLQYRNHRNGTELRRTDNKASPRVGIVVKPAAAASAYASYSVSFLPGSGNQFTTLTVTTQTLEPEQFTTYEAGVKWDAGRDLSLAAALYRLDRTNTAAPDPNDPTRTVQTGSQRSSGFELTASGKPVRAWQMLLGYGYQDVEITGRTTNALPGAKVALTPHHQLSMWNRYQVTSALGLGLGLIHQTSMFAAVDNTVTLPGFMRVDAAVFLNITRRIRAQVNGENLLDARYFATAHSNNNITPGSPRAVRAGLDIRY